MKKRDIWISVAIIAMAAVLLSLYFRGSGWIEIDSGSAAAALQLRSGWSGRTTITSGAEAASAGAGVQRPRRLTLSMDRDGHNWRVISRGPWSDLSRIRVKNLNTTSLKLGSPLLIEPEVRTNGSNIDIGFEIIDQAGERYQKFPTMDNRTVRKAKVRIVDETGKILRTGSIRYG